MDLATFLPTIDARSVRPIRRVEYDKLVEAGTFEGERVELLYGVVVRMSPIGPRHNYSVQELNARFVRALHGRAVVRIQMSFAASDDSEPEPDLAVVPPGKYWLEHPRSASLVIEVAETSIKDDRQKAILYGSSNVDEYWIVNLVDDEVEVYRAPSDGTFRERTVQRRGAELTMLAFPDVLLRVDDLLPPR
jgi:Uma2 family endonuclease